MADNTKQLTDEQKTILNEVREQCQQAYPFRSRRVEVEWLVSGVRQNNWHVKKVYRISFVVLFLTTRYRQ